MRSLTMMFLAGMAACSNAQIAPQLESYSLLLRDDGKTWCAYRNPTDFQAEVTRLKPMESARITYSSNKLTELTYQVEAEGGDWIVIDKYTPTDGGVLLRRANLMAQENLQVIQEAVIRGANADSFNLISVSTLDGKTAELPPSTDFPEVPVRTNLLATPFAQVVIELRSRSVGQLCNKGD